MSSRRNKGERSDTEDSEVNAMEILDDVVLLIDGKKLKTNSTLLAHNSSKFAGMIGDARKKQRADDTVILYDSRAERLKGSSGRGDDRGLDAVTIELPDHCYSEMKLLVKAIENHKFKPDSLTGEKALKILPLTEKFKMKRMKRRCGDALVDSLKQLQKKQSRGSVPTSELFKYLSAADKYRLSELREMCLDACAKCHAASHRDVVLNDRHVTEASKTQIFNRMCDKMSEEYEHNLRDIRKDMNARCEEIEKSRREFMETIEAWKEELQAQVDEMIEKATASHDKLHEDFVQKKIIEQLTATVEQNSESLQFELQQLETDINDVVHRLEENDKKEDREPPENLWDMLTSAHEKAMTNLDEIPEQFQKSVKLALINCKVEDLRTSVNDSYALQKRHGDLSDELVSTIKKLSEAEAKFQQESLDHEKTRVQLVQYQKREHSVNTWIRWAKPPTDKADECTCFRHSRERRPFNN